MTHWNTGTCETNGITLHFTRTGGYKPPILLLHGLTASGDCWTEVAQTLESDYDVIMPDARGHGLSSKPDSGYRYQDLADDVVGFIKTLELPPVILVGHSMGGMSAALAVSQHSELVRRLVLGDPSFLSPEVQQEVSESDVIEQHQRYLKMPLTELVAEARAKHPARSLETLERVARARLDTCLAAFEVLTPPNPNYMEVMRSIEIPCLLVIGGPSGVVTPETAAELQQINPRLQVAQIPQAEHGMHYDQPENFALLIKNFLESEFVI